MKKKRPLEQPVTKFMLATLVGSPLARLGGGEKGSSVEGENLPKDGGRKLLVPRVEESSRSFCRCCQKRKVPKETKYFSLGWLCSKRLEKNIFGDFFRQKFIYALLGFFFLTQVGYFEAIKSGSAAGLPPPARATEEKEEKEARKKKIVRNV